MYFIKHFYIYIIIYITRTQSEIPVVSVYITSSSNNSCNGLMLDDQFLITSASCLQDHITLITNEKKHDIQMIEVHPDFKINYDRNNENDVALLRLTKPLAYGSYRAVIIENLRDGIYEEMNHKCSSFYWERGLDTDRIIMKIISFKNFTIANCDESMYLLQNFLNTTTENICKEYLVTFGESEENLQNFTNNSLPLFCNGQFYGFLSSVTLKEDIKFFTWLRVSGYSNWLQAVIEREHEIDYNKTTVLPKLIKKEDVSPNNISYDIQTAHRLALYYVASNLDLNLKSPLSPMTNNFKRSKLRPEDVIPLFGWPKIYPPNIIQRRYRHGKPIGRSGIGGIDSMLGWIASMLGAEWPEAWYIPESAFPFTLPYGFWTMEWLSWTDVIDALWPSSTSTKAPRTMTNLILSTWTIVITLVSIILATALLMYLLIRFCKSDEPPTDRFMGTKKMWQPGPEPVPWNV